MAGKRICKICGCEYDYCHTNRRTTIFRWQDVACSPEHGAIYFAKIVESRKADFVQDNDIYPHVVDSGVSEEDTEVE